MVNPGVVAEGIAISLIPTDFGLTILAVSAIVWFGLKCRLYSLASRTEEDRLAGV